MDKSEAKEAASAEATKLTTRYVHKILGTTYTYEGSERIHIQANVFLKPA